MKYLRNITMTIGALSFSAIASAITVSSQGAGVLPATRSASTAPVVEKKLDAALQIANGVVKNVDTAKLIINLNDGRLLQLHSKTQVFKGSEKGSIYSISAGQDIEFALDIGSDVQLSKDARKAVEDLKSQRLEAVGKGKTESSRAALIRIKLKAENTQ